jgi:hypothetical protein
LVFDFTFLTTAWPWPVRGHRTHEGTPFDFGSSLRRKNALALIRKLWSGVYDELSIIVQQSGQSPTFTFFALAELGVTTSPRRPPHCRLRSVRQMTTTEQY